MFLPTADGSTANTTRKKTNKLRVETTGLRQSYLHAIEYPSMYHRITKQNKNREISFQWELPSLLCTSYSDALANNTKNYDLAKGASVLTPCSTPRLIIAEKT